MVFIIIYSASRASRWTSELNSGSEVTVDLCADEADQYKFIHCEKETEVIR